MHTVDDLLGMIHTEAAEENAEASASAKSGTVGESLAYDLELVKKPDGSLVWKED